MDTLETADAFGIGVRPVVPYAAGLDVAVAIDPYRTPGMDAVIDQWVPLVFTVNSLNRSKGLAELYPFVISDAVRDKLGFVHAMVHERPTAP